MGVSASRAAHHARAHQFASGASTIDGVESSFPAEISAVAQE